MKSINIFLICFISIVLSCRDTKNTAITTDYKKKIIPYDNVVNTLDYLKEYMIDYSTEKNGFGQDYFEIATARNTDLLREIVHQANYKNKAKGRRPKKELQGKVGYMFQDSVGENCGFMSTTLYDIYKAFGFKVRRYDVIDGTLDGFLKYRDSHVFVEVYIPEKKKYIIQDPTINNSMLSCENKERLSFEEIRKTIYLDDSLPCFSQTKVSKWMSPSEHLTERQKMGVFEDYYTASILSIKMFDGEKETESKLHDLKIIANEKRRVSDLAFLKDLCATCKFDEKEFSETLEFQDFMKCLNSKILAHGVLTTSFNKDEKGFLIQYTNEKGQNVLYDPTHKFSLAKSYFNYKHWDLNNRGYLKDRDLKYMVLSKIYSSRTNEVFEF